MAYATADELATALRTTATDANRDVLQRCVDAASEEIDHWIDAEDGLALSPVPALVKTECIERGVEWWKANDAALGVLGYNDTGKLTPPDSTFDRHAAILLPLKERWGVA